MQNWIRLYKSCELAGLETGSKCTTHSAETKQNAVQGYLNHRLTLSDVLTKYKICSSTQLRRWVMKYNSHKELKSSRSSEVSVMTKGRKTLYDERIEIIQFCIENNNDNAKAAEKYDVSYQQVYSWIKKYEAKGAEGLLDIKGHTKPKDEMIQSMSRISRCIDNGPMEAFWGMLKTEMYYLKKFNSYSELEKQCLIT